MGSGAKFCTREVANKRLDVYRGVLLIVLFVLCARAVGAESGKKSLREIHDQAEELAQTPGGADSAIAKYRSVLEIHRENEKLFQSALRKLGKHYRESDRAEEGARLLLDLAYDLQTQSTSTGKVLRDILHEYSLTHRALLEKIVAEKGFGSGPKPKSTSTPKAKPISPSKEIADAILQRKDKALREKSLARLREMLSAESSDADKGAALATLRMSLTAKFDRAPLRVSVLPLLKSEVAEIRALALQCLPGLEATAADLDHVIPLAEDPSIEVRRNAGGAMIQLGKGEKGDKVIPALTKLLEDEEYKVIERTLRSMWGQYSSPQFDALLIKLSRDQRHRGHVIYNCLSTMRRKSPAVCSRLIEELDERDWNDSGRAAWGLTYGVSEEAKSLVEEGLLKALPEETNSYTRGNEFKALRRVATEKSRPYLQTVVDSEMETDERKEQARTILADLDRKRSN